jgi:hypothetical protein
LIAKNGLIEKKGRNLGMNGCVFCVVWVHGSKRLFCNIVSKTSTTCDLILGEKREESFGSTFIINASKSMPRLTNGLEVMFISSKEKCKKN